MKMKKINEKEKKSQGEGDHHVVLPPKLTVNGF